MRGNELRSENSISTTGPIICETLPDEAREAQTNLFGAFPKDSYVVLSPEKSEVFSIKVTV
jgi:hypothetical protein